MKQQTGQLLGGTPRSKADGRGCGGTPGALAHSAAASRKTAGEQVTCACSVTLTTPGARPGVPTQSAPLP